MGGTGSGRPRADGRGLTETYYSLDVDQLRKAGVLVPGSNRVWSWSFGGKQVAAVCLSFEQNRLNLSYSIQIGDGPWKPLSETVGVVWLNCTYGGNRPYLICPAKVDGVDCDRRVRKLYLRSGLFRCRGCHRLAYACQSEVRWERALRRANKIRQQLGGKPGLQQPLADPPKGMWQETYDRHWTRIMRAEIQACEALSGTARFRR